MNSHEIVFRNATLIDGTGASRFGGDLGVRGDRISGVGDLTWQSGEIEIDGSGLVLAPGFIDAHHHVWLA